jgi:hypothetical protein
MAARTKAHLLVKTRAIRIRDKNAIERFENRSTANSTARREVRRGTLIAVSQRDPSGRANH